ncbi:hypothetical protein BDR03DRAFT_987893 [Suillus americanus]|nr:hypothetical protein BDR03DRAFT_987893 [Suillus americanus]
MGYYDLSLKGLAGVHQAQMQELDQFGHKLFLKAPLSEDSPLYGSLVNLAGLNLFTGDGEVMLDFNFKHLFKCICMLIWSPAQLVLNNGRVINLMVLLHYLVWLPAYDEEAVIKLLYPDDLQDVPALQAACDLLWVKATNMNVSLNSIAVVVPSDPKVFPYQFADGTLAVVSIGASTQLAASGGEHITTCLLYEPKVFVSHA